jgi:5-methylcytosine-specific restriction endonuclease McrA
MRDMASILDTQDYLLLTFEEWIELGRDTGRSIQTPHRSIAAPEVVVLKKYGERPTRRVVFNKPNLARRDQFQCQYCGVVLVRQEVTIEHVLPRSRGGETGWLNCVAACEDCNGRKSNLTPKEAGMPLKRQPAVPEWKVGIQLPSGYSRQAWIPFLTGA